MNVIKLFALLASTSILSGCLWVCRVPFPVKQEFSDEGECTNAVYKSMITCIRENENTNLYCSVCGLYPLTRMRIDVTYEAWKGMNTEGLKGEELYNAKWANRTMPVMSTLLWLGEPLDLIVDTCMIPWDW